MKVWIVGPQGTCKNDIISLLEDDKLKVGKLFTNEKPENMQCCSNRYLYYDNETLKSIFENNAYVFMNDVIGKFGVQEGLGFDEYDSKDIFVLSIDHFISLNSKYISKNDLVVWLDGTKNWRMSNINKCYDYMSREKIENSCYEQFGEMISSLSNYKNVIYFYEELPERVKTIVKIIYNNPKLKSEFVKYFNSNL